MTVLTPSHLYHAVNRDMRADSEHSAALRRRRCPPPIRKQLLAPSQVADGRARVESEGVHEYGHREDLPRGEQRHLCHVAAGGHVHRGRRGEEAGGA